MKMQNNKGIINMKKLIIYTTLLFACSVGLSEDIVLFDAKDTNPAALKSKNPRDGSGAIIATLNPIIFDGDFNLDANRKIAIDLENPEDTLMRIYIDFLNNPKKKNREMNRRISAIVMPKEKGRVIVDALKPLKHPEILSKMKIMRNDPFARCDRNESCDMSKVKRININTSMCSANGGRVSPVRITKITALDTSSEKLPKWYYMSEDEFFPFIDKYGQFKFKEWKNKVHSDADLQKQKELELKDIEAHPGSGEWNKYGGWEKGPQLEATGRFRVQKYNGKWWMVDPEGKLFWSHGVVRVTPSSAVTPLDGREFYFENLPGKDDEFALFYTTKDELLAPYYTKRGLKKTYDFSAANIYRKYGKNWRSEYADMAHKRLKSWGLNTIANSSDRFIYSQNKTPFIERLETRGPSFTGSKGWWPICDPFDPEFRSYLRSELESRKSEFTNPWCIGLFVDNEHHWGNPEFIGKCTLMSPSTLKAKGVFVSDLRNKYKTIDALNKAWKSKYADWNDILNSTDVPAGADKSDLASFSAKVIDTYFKTIRDEIKSFDPKLLYMGCRFAGANPMEMILGIAEKYCDVISYNIYKFRLDNFKLPKGIDKPVIIGEFHFGAVSDTGKFNPTLVFAKDQDTRAKCYKQYVRDSLEHPNIIGTHWHQFSDQATTGRFDGENFQVGFTDVCDTPYSETIDALREMGKNLYKIRSGLSN